MESQVEFKRRIDSARNILVGVVPSPAGQIDQITYAMIYKFISDIDDKTARLPGGKRQYFVGEYERFDWHNLMRLDGQDKLNLYRDALASMSKNPHLPELFRTIYQNAFLPFNDPRTLNLFLKEIDGFTHTKSDAIGDAYEYLLNITGAQGDVGQFRTPRHIIRFIVDAVQPGKEDTVLDPAVGTAGFLIAAYNYVRRQHDGVDENGEPNGEQRLSADEHKKLYGNYHGYDIDPTMVRTASVNMYLHGFSTPNIEIHDTLTSEEHWANRYDVILANPPFMTPKGGIEPHGKFGVKANRAEVLFVDYIASHLKPNGRAGIVVPEGIIFQSGKSYKELRKNLVENYLYAVVSLPAGVFQPYSGVKTSVLLLDKELAQAKDEVLFVKVENDGYSTGANRREIAGDQFPEALEVIERFKRGEELQTGFAHAVPRSEIAESGDYNLSGDRYKASTLASSSNYDYFAIEGLVETITASVKIKTADLLDAGHIPVIDQSQKFIAGYTDEERAIIEDVPVVAFGDHTKAVKYIDFPFAQGADGIKILSPKDNSLLDVKYLYYTMSNMGMPDKGYSRHWTDVKKLKIPLPPIETQREIVAELDGYQCIIDAAQTIVKSYKPTIKINPEWEVDKIDNLVTVVNGSTPLRSNQGYWQDGDVPWFTIEDIRKNGRIVEGTLQHITRRALDETSIKVVPKDSVLICCTASIGEHAIAKVPLATNQQFNALVVRDREKINPSFLFHLMPSIKGELMRLAGTTSFGFVSGKSLKSIELPLPPIEIQREIVTELEAEQKLIDANKKLIEIYQAKTKSKIAEVWGE